MNKVVEKGSKKMVFDNFVEAEIGGKKYKFSLKNRKAFLAERELQSKNLLTTLEKQPMCLEDLYILFKYSITEVNMNDDECFDLFTNAIGEMTYVKVFSLMLECLMKSGLLGDVKKLKATMNV